MNIIKTIVLFAVMVVAMTAKGQDAQFSQFYAAPLYLNPGFTGSTEQQRVSINHRVQWPNLPHAFSSSSASYEFYNPKIRSGFGILFSTDAMGSAGWRSTMVGLSYSFKTQLGNDWIFSPGLNFSYGNNGLDRTKLKMRDGLLYGDGMSYDPELDRIGNASYFDFSAGTIFYNKTWWFGFAGHHLNKPNISIIGEDSRLPVKMTMHGGVTVPLYNGPKKLANVHYLTPSFIFRSHGSTQQIDAGLRYHVDPVAIGVWYRGLPVGGNDADTDEIQVSQGEALVFIASLLFNNFQFGYSYDFALAEAQSSTGGAHEISLSYEFARKRKPGGKSQMLLPCPTFLRSELKY